jgi:hypothetical protein
MEYYYPRASGKWEPSLQLLKQAWRKGKETAMFTGQVFNPKQKQGSGLCPVCGESVHTAPHIEKVTAT